MERGLLWTPLLVLFIWLAWAGWNEYQKLEAYKVWAQSFERSKYDILAALGQVGDTLTWGKPTRSGPANLQSVDRQHIAAVQLWVDNQEIPPDNGVEGGKKAHIALQMSDPAAKNPIVLPFTDVQMAMQWASFLRRWINGEVGENQRERPSSSETS